MTASAVHVSDTLVAKAMRASGKRDRESLITHALKVLISVSPPANPAYALDDGPLTEREVKAIRKATPQRMSKQAKNLF